MDPADLSESEQGFLQARRSYLTEEQRITFGITEPEEEDWGKPELKSPAAEAAGPNLILNKLY